ncbi:MAG: hypothetical protein IPK19_18685 [Chloroflexi bacterium]|nr:hypothetical protein [Chloroflexota bacterium]
MILRVIISLVENAIKHPARRLNQRQRRPAARRRGGGQHRRHRPGASPASFRLDVFDKYFRIHQHRAVDHRSVRIGAPVQETPDVSTRGGLGLGLAFCRLAIEAHNGLDLGRRLRRAAGDVRPSLQRGRAGTGRVLEMS